MKIRLLTITLFVVLYAFPAAACDSYPWCQCPVVTGSVDPVQQDGTFRVWVTRTDYPQDPERMSAFAVYFRGTRVTYGEGGRPPHLPPGNPTYIDLSAACMIEPSELRIVPTDCWFAEYLPGQWGTTIGPPGSNKPGVSVSFSAQNGGVASIPYEFPFTATPQQRSVALYRDGVFFGSAPSPAQNGSWSPTVGTCWKELRVVATACGGGPANTTEKTIKNPLGQLKPIAVSVLKIGMNGNTAVIQATVSWTNATPGSTVSVDRKNWIDGKGQSHGGGPLTTFANVVPSKTETFTFNAPDGARQLSVVATVQTPCGIVKDDDSVGCDACQATGNPVYWSDGNMRLTDGEPLPPIAGQALVRTYDSEEQVGGVFGRGWTSVFERRLIAHTDGSVSIVTGTNEVVTFRLVSGVYRQTWPQSVRALGTLMHDSGAGTYSYRAPGSTEMAVFRASDGRLIRLRDTAGAREAVLAYDAQGRPATFTDSVTEVTWNLALDAQRRVTSIDVAGHPELAWTYTYDAANNLLTVLAPGAAPWRTYEYLGNRMTASRDALGHLIESHSYDAQGYAKSSTGDIDEIESIDYGLAGPAAGDRVTRITYRTGAISEYTLRPIGGAWRPVQVAGGCASCGTRDATYLHDAWGRVIREQGPDGYITATTYANFVVTSVQESLKPVGCDPQTDPQHCRLQSNALAAATLEPTSSSVTTTYEYGDPLWPDRPTTIRRPSIVWPAQFRDENRLYHPTTGALTRHEHHALQGDLLLSRDTSWTFYEGSGNAPVFDPGGVFQSGWLSLPQPLYLIKTVNGPRTDVQDISSYVYYPIDSSVPPLLRSRLAAVKNAAGHITRYESYDLFGNATRVVDPNGVATEMTFDALGRPLTTTTKAVPGCNTALDPLCSVDVTTTRVYTPASGPLTRVTNPRRGVTVYTYDDRGRLHTLSRGSGVEDLSERIETTYDPFTGKKSHESRQAFLDGEWTEQWSQSFVYDNRARLQSVVHADGAAVHYTYDAEDRIATVRDENHAAPNTAYAYDPAGRVSRVTQTLASQPGGTIATHYTYHLDGNLASVTDPNGNVTTYFYNDLGDLRTQTSPVTGETSYEYDKAGNLVFAMDANGMLTTRQYDALNRVTGATSEGAGLTETVTWSYDDPATGRFGIGRLTSSTDPSGDVAYSYERRGLLRKETRHISAVSQTHTTSYAYDADGNRSTVTYPSGLSVEYGFDHAGRPTSATGVVVEASYLPFGPMTSLELANGTRQFMSYDTRYRMTDNGLFTVPAPPAKPLLLASYTYEHDDAGNITGIQDNGDASYNRAFQYDDLNRLTVANTGSSLWQTGSYSWDAMGNPKTMSLGTAAGRSSTFAYEGTTAKLASVTNNGVPRVVEYDAAGNETSYLATRSYSPRNLIEEIVDAGLHPRTIRNTYDGRGIRVVSETSGGIVASTSRTYLYTPEMQLMAVTAPNVATIDYEIVWFAGRPVAQITSTGTRYTFADHLGTPIAQTGASATVIWRAEYEPFGNIFKMRTGTRTDQPLRFPGQEVAFSWEGQEENYNIHRWYRSGWGRYTQGDPLGLSGGGNLYNYPHNPIMAADYYGLFATDNGTLKSPIATTNVLAACKTSPVACTLGLGAAISFKCTGCGDDWHATDVTLHIRGQVYAYSGNPQLLKLNIVDKSVTSFASAVQHEQAWHIAVASAAVGPLIGAFENMHFESKDNCNDWGTWTNWNVQSRFVSVYTATQKIENAGGNPTGVPF